MTTQWQHYCSLVGRYRDQVQENRAAFLAAFNITEQGRLTLKCVTTLSETLNPLLELYKLYLARQAELENEIVLAAAENKTPLQQLLKDLNNEFQAAIIGLL